MVEWRNTVSGHVTGPVVQAAHIDAVYLPGSTVPVDGPPLTSWQDRPELPAVLRDLLAAQYSATESLPYKLLRVEQPELRQVYVQQTMRTQSSPTQAGSGERVKQQIADYWLNAREGEPPLTEPVLPLRIPARALAGRAGGVRPVVVPGPEPDHRAHQSRRVRAPGPRQPPA